MLGMMPKNKHLSNFPSCMLYLSTKTPQWNDTPNQNQRQSH